MGHDWRQIPALLAGAGVLAVTLYVVQPPAGGAGPLHERPLEQTILHPSPAAMAATRPSEALARVVERTARGALSEPYFVDQQEAGRFLERWQGRLIEGKALVAQADQFDAGAENGHRAPVTLWLDSGSRVMGLSGEAVFVPTPGGLKLRGLRLQPIKLRVSTWGEAAEQLGQSYSAGGKPEQGVAPFYGLFRFHLNGHRYAVDARTGEATQE